MIASRSAPRQFFFAHRVKRRAGSSSSILAGAALVLRRAAPTGARVGAIATERLKRRGDPAVSAQATSAATRALGLGAIDEDDLGPLAEHGAQKASRVHRDADDQRDVGLPSPWRRASKNSS
jgi:hypothetical protein